MSENLALAPKRRLPTADLPGAPDPEINAGFIRSNSDAYEWLVQAIQANMGTVSAEETLKKIEDAARFAGDYHTGRFCDGAIENLALQIGRSLDDQFAESEFGVRRHPDSPRRVLHVSHRVLGVGGHTRTILHWTRADKSSIHSLFLLNQGDVEVPSWLDEAIRDGGGQVRSLPSAIPLLQKAVALRDHARTNADLVILHHFASDIVPTVAFAGRNNPPVAVSNHADHLFWLGSSVIDIAINSRSASSALSRGRRQISRNVVLPLPLVDDSADIRRADARAKLGIPDDELVILTIARAEKFRPCPPYDFFATVARILDRAPQTRLYVVGETLEGMLPLLSTQPHPNVHFVGSVENHAEYRAAADLYLESFPFGSLTALLEATLSKLPVVPAYAPLHPLLVSTDDALETGLLNPKSEEEYIERALHLLRDSELRRSEGEILRKLVLADHVADGWMRRLRDVYRETDRLRHAPHPIVPASCIVEEGDMELSMWQAVSRRKAVRDDPLREEQHALLHAVTAHAFVENYAGVRSIVSRSLWRAPLQRFSWHLLAIGLRKHAGGLKRRLWSVFRSGRHAPSNDRKA